ncbi:hypothetical protein Ae201684_016331 [Aphanomyces euteiches]|uniref:Uncharacterized protein n=1 Tax=Aphanomyces euteiches TaxID=100861 RepID=A0A6G0WFK9_9STRA|nr:hypothetical protein Ae201684_016331 [Aphanomyces euteiches]KAH9138131.1 hypothetical protein AeRB84_017493 [Aphanomyces euteiches]
MRVASHAIGLESNAPRLPAEIRRPAVKVSFTRWSLAYNAMFVFNLITTPFMAYLNEPHPGQVIENPMDLAAPFEEYTKTMTSFFRQIYNNETMDPQSTTQRDLVTNTFALRRSMTLPFEIALDETFDYMVNMPASLYYGSGLRSYVLAFLTANQTNRADQSWEFCQHEFLAGMSLIEHCVWIDPIEETTANSTQYMMYTASWIRESNISIWLRFPFRCFVSIYVSYRLWTNYYAHYRPLVTNLSSLGFSKDYLRYEIVLGDPAYAILSDPFVSFAMVIDLFWSALYITLAIIRVSQVHGIIVYINGCLYLSRCVWLAYLGMRTMASVVKWRRWEASFESVDPGLLAILAYVYSGPIITLMGATRVVSVFHVFWNIGLAPSSYGQGTEAASVVAFLVIVMTTIPLPFSTFLAFYRRRKANSVKPSRSLRSWSKNMSHYAYNDLKARILLSLTMKKLKNRSIGGRLHQLYELSPCYRKLPLYSHRAADCFVLCYTSDGSLDQQVRLSLLTCLDLQQDNVDFAILTCNSSFHCNCVCLINSKCCEALKMEMKSGKFVLHRGNLNCAWVM